MRKIKLILLFIIILLLQSSSANPNYQNVHIVNYENPLSLKTIKSRYLAFDSIDGDITKNIEFETAYNENNCHLGTYDLKVSITNSRYITKTHYDLILVKDFNGPIISTANSEIYIDLSNNNIKDDILNSLVIEDNIDKEFSEIVISNIEQLYTPGQYIVEVYVVDSQTNKSNTISLTINVFESVINNILNYEMTLETPNVSQDEIINKFLKDNEISTNYQSISINSNYFANDITSGIYISTITIIYENDLCHKYEFKINYKPAVTSDQPNYTIYIVIFTSSFILILLIIFYRKIKKH